MPPAVSSSPVPVPLPLPVPESPVFATVTVSVCFVVCPAPSVATISSVCGPSARSVTWNVNGAAVSVLASVPSIDSSAFTRSVSTISAWTSKLGGTVAPFCGCVTCAVGDMFCAGGPYSATTPSRSRCVNARFVEVPLHCG